MFPDVIVQFFAQNQELLWFTTLILDLAATVTLYRLFGKTGLQVAIATAIILANLQGPKFDVTQSCCLVGTFCKCVHDSQWTSNTCPGDRRCTG